MPQRSTVKLGPGRGEVNGQRLRGCPAGTAIGLSPATTSLHVRRPVVQRWLGPLQQRPVAEVRAAAALEFLARAAHQLRVFVQPRRRQRQRPGRSEEHTSELQSLMRISYAVFCLKKKKK